MYQNHEFKCQRTSQNLPIHEKSQYYEDVQKLNIDCCLACESKI
jgi:hypothetical protein